MNFEKTQKRLGFFFIETLKPTNVQTQKLNIMPHLFSGHQGVVKCLDIHLQTEAFMSKVSDNTLKIWNCE